MAKTPTQPETLPTMSFGEHLEELRRRIIHALWGLLLALGFTFYYGRELIAFIYAPLAEVQRQANLPMQTYTRAPLSGFMVYMKVSLVAAILLSAPWMLYQFWRFVSAGLYTSERKIAAAMIFLSGIMTSFGLAFMYYFLLPAALTFLIQFTTTYPVNVPQHNGILSRVTQLFMKMNSETLLPGAGAGITEPTTQNTTQPILQGIPLPAIVPSLEQDPSPPREGELWFNRQRNELRFFQHGQVRVLTMTAPSAMIPLIDPNDYIQEVTWLALTVMVMFQVPVIMAMLGLVGLGNPDWLAKKRKMVIIIIVLGAVFLTPSQDIFSNIVIPLLAWLLFEFGLLLMRLFSWRRKKRLAAEAAEAAED